MAKLDVNENEGENGKEEHQVPHLGEYGKTFAIIVLPLKRSIMKTLISLKMRLLADKVPTTGGGVVGSKSASFNRSSQLCSDTAFLE